jgi:hypothetical protein
MTMPTLNDQALYKILFDWYMSEEVGWLESYYYAEDRAELFSYIQKVEEDNEVRNMRVYKAPFRGWEEIVLP